MLSELKTSRKLVGMKQIRRALQELETMDHRLKSGGGMSEYRTAFLRMYGKI